MQDRPPQLTKCQWALNQSKRPMLSCTFPNVLTVQTPIIQTNLVNFTHKILEKLRTVSLNLNLSLLIMNVQFYHEQEVVKIILLFCSVGPFHLAHRPRRLQPFICTKFLV